MIHGCTKLLGVIGKPVGHSLSPEIHNFSADFLGIDSTYVPLPYSGSHLPGLLQSLWDLGFQGLNVTVPFKEQVASLFPDSNLQSVNTLSRGTDYWQCHSTDGLGFMRSIEQWADTKSFDQFVILGNGGASLAVVEAWLMKHPKARVQILRRSKERDSSFLKFSKSDLSFHDFSEGALESILKSGTSLLVQATSAPLFGNDLHSLSGAMDSLKGAFIDLLYGESVSSLLPKAKLIGADCEDGLGMLVGQALASQDLWWKESAPFDEVLNFLRAKD